MNKISATLFLIGFIFYIYSCQSPQASENAGEMGKLLYTHKVIDVNKKVINNQISRLGQKSTHLRQKLIRLCRF